MKRLLVVFFAFSIMFCGAVSTPVFADELPSEVRVIAVKTTIYSEPNISKPMMTGASELKVEHGKVFEVVGESGDFYEISFTITIGDATTQTSGYILKAYCLNTEIKGLHVNIQTNAHLRNQTVVYNQSGEEFIESQISLDKDFRVRLVDGFDQSKKYTRIMFDHEGDTYTAFVSTSSVIPDGISMNTAIAIGLIIASVSIILILFGFSAHKRKRRKNKNK